MRVKTELRMIIDHEPTILDKYINRVISGDIKNLTIKEEWIMLEALRVQREEYVAELEALKNTNLDELKNARFELLREQIALEVEKEHADKIAAAELNVTHYDFVIRNLEAKEEAELAQEIDTENLGG